MICLAPKKNDTKIIKEALKALGKENLALIIHGGSFPSVQGEDTGFGTVKYFAYQSRSSYTAAIRAIHNMTTHKMTVSMFGILCSPRIIFAPLPKNVFSICLCCAEKEDNNPLKSISQNSSLGKSDALFL